MQSNPTLAFVALGGNIGNTLSIFNSAASALRAHTDIKEVVLSRFYLTSPVSEIPQDPYINAVCSIKTTLELRPFFNILKSIEKQHGKTDVVQKNAPRVIDLDLLFFGEQSCFDDDLTVPHPRWQNRLFVLRPLRDLTNKVIVPCGIDTQKLQIIDLDQYMQTFTNSHNETIYPLN